MDNIATAEELIFSLHKRRLPGLILKVDFAKVFDLVDWNFLFYLLKQGASGKDGWDGFRVFCSSQRQLYLSMDLQMATFAIKGIETRRSIIAFVVSLSYGYAELDVLACTKIQGLGRCTTWEVGVISITLMIFWF